jgi:hypothetical protein
MGDYSQASVTVYGVAGKEAELAEALDAAELQVDWGRHAGVEASDVVEGHTFCEDEARLDFCDKMAKALEPLGISYWANQDAKYEFDGTVRMYTPELGSFEGTGSQEGESLLYGSVVDSVVDAAMSATPDPAEALTLLVEGLNALTGRAHRQHFYELAAAPKAA